MALLRDYPVRLRVKGHRAVRGFVLASALCLFGLGAQAASPGGEGSLGTRAPKFSLEALLPVSHEPAGGQFALFLYPEPEEITEASVAPKRPGLALLLSAVVPGAGQLYTGSGLVRLGSPVRAAIYFGLEAGGWFGWNSMRTEGKDLEEEYKTLADQYWDYAEWVGPCGKPEGTHEIKTRELVDGQKVPIKDDNYYENIGKYDQFACGWVVEGKRMKYLDLRHDSNTSFKRARNFGTVVMFNHILSAFDAVWSAKRVNDRAMAASLRIVPTTYGEERLNTLQLTLVW